MTHGMCGSRPGLRIVLGMMFVTLLADPLSAQTNGVFDATSGHIVVPYAPALDFGAQLTIEAWVRPNLQLSIRRRGGQGLRHSVQSWR